MSAENRICYLYFPRWDSPNFQWAAWHGSGSVEYHEPPNGSHWFSSEEEMMEWVRNEEKTTQILEHGAGPVSVEEQRAGLIWTIKDLVERLSLLSETGCQFKARNEDRDE